MTIKQTILDAFSKKNEFTLKEAYVLFPEKKESTIRARIYENLNTLFEKIDKSKYKVISDGQETIIINGDGRNLSSLNNESIDCILTDHPWEDKKSNKGGNRNFATYDSFQYNQEDFNEKYRVLKEGRFLIEFIPSENANNFDYIYQLKKMAQKAGFQYYSKIPWIKGTFVSNTGRNSKNSEDILFFTKGKAMNLRPDQKKNKQTNTTDNFMSGTAKMLPTEFNVQPASRNKKIHQSEKPIELIQQILEYVTIEQNIVLDQFIGSGNFLIAAIKNKCRAIGFEINKETFNKAKENLRNNSIPYLQLN